MNYDDIHVCTRIREPTESEFRCADFIDEGSYENFKGGKQVIRRRLKRLGKRV